LLGALVVAAGHAVPVDRLRAAIWSEDAPRTADSSLQTYVSRLRHLLGADTIVHEDHTYRLDVTRDQIDALRFEDLLAEAAELRETPADCAALCEEALGLWRGDPFGDLRDDEAFRLEAMRLEELRLATMELALGAELALGHHEIVVAELESAVHEHPYREHLWYLLVEALAASDRRVDALRTCRDLRSTLAAVGLSPGEEIRGLEQRILLTGDGGSTTSTANGHRPERRAATRSDGAPSA
jgi:DNA-binding SARP family transcriptional activator